MAQKQGLSHRVLARTVNGRPIDDRFDSTNFWPIDLDATEVVIGYENPETGTKGTCVIPIP